MKSSGNMKKNRIITTSFRNIKQSSSRFLSLLIMSLLGVGVFAGLLATEPDMMKTLDNYLDEGNNYDIKIVSNLGLDDKDLKALSNISSVKVEESIDKDVLIKIKDDEFAIKVINIPSNINKIKLLSGRLPIKNSEIVVEENMLTKESLKIGDEIELDDNFNNNKVTIVGTVENSLYFNNSKIKNERGKTSIGTGTIKYYTYTLTNNFASDYFTSIYLTINGLKEELTNSNKYLDSVESTINKIESIKDKEINRRYNEIYSKAYDEIKVKEEEANQKLDSMLATLNLYGASLEPYYEQKAKVDKEFKEAYEKLDEIKKPIWYIYDRTDDSTYNDYINDSNSIKNLSKIFPVIFFAVAILISLISMNRMVEEDRSEIGTLKSLGFNNGHIIFKYFIFSFLAVLIGGILGSILGLTIIPSIIWDIYKILFNVPNFVLLANMDYTMLGFLLALICICGTTLLTTYRVLKEKPSELMRPKAPKKGKRVLLERIKFIWSRLKFSSKVTIRNLFRYKKRALMTIVGIAGCTSLLLIGFGIRDAISDVTRKQYKEINTYDALVYLNLKDNSNTEDVFDINSINKHIDALIINSTVNSINVSLFVPDNADKLDNVYNLYDIETNEEVKIKDNEVIITDKLATLLNKNVGDKIEILDADNNSYNYKISNIVRNYINHYIFMSKDTYSKTSTYKTNVSFLKINNINANSSINKKLLDNNNVLTVMFIDDLMDSANNMLGSLNSVVAILIILASMLAFVVLYNLSSITINERKREIATLKVLGFYNKEVNNYITKENIILTIIGIFFGLILGNYLTRIIISTVEVENVRYVYQIKPLSYIYSILLATLFATIINFITHFVLKKINMIESLKSVE